ncbi:MAG: hypothetical protein JJU28_05155 [Cyclobacteriaceae bacterium]|nr:hypothetical protein [Cyclobacteriaceae bacterium]
MKKLQMIILLVSMFSVTMLQAQRGPAQRGQSTGERPGAGNDPSVIAERQANHMKAELNLSDEQYQKVLEINRAAAEKRIETREEVRQQRQAVRENMGDMHNERLEALKEVLTEEQLEKYRNMQNQERPQMQQRQRGQEQKEKPKPGKRSGRSSSGK